MGHSYHRNAPCGECGDLDGCHRWRQAQVKREREDPTVKAKTKPVVQPPEPEPKFEIMSVEDARIGLQGERVDKDGYWDYACDHVVVASKHEVLSDVLYWAEIAEANGRSVVEEIKWLLTKVRPGPMRNLEK